MGDFDINEIKTSTVETTNKTKLVTPQLFKKLLLIIIFISIVLLVLVIFSYKYRNRTDDLTIGYTDKEGITLVTISEHLDFFQENGIRTDYRQYDDELKLLQALQESRIDVAFVEDISVAMSPIDISNYKIIASVANAEKYFFVVDLKKGIFNISNLEGEVIGITDLYKTDFWMEKGLSQSSLDKRDIVTENMKPDKLAESLADAKVTSIFTWQPYAYEAEVYEGTDVQQLLLPVQNGQGAYTYMLASEDYIEHNYSTLQSFLTSLINSEEYIGENESLVVDYLTAEWATDKRYVTDILESFVFRVEISQQSKASLIEKFEWAKKKNKKNDEFLIENSHYYKLLREIDPNRAEF